MQAQKAGQRGEVPVGAVIIDPRKNLIIASSGNRVQETNDPTAHAEVLVIREATKILGSPRLKGYNLFVTLEPCPMCAFTISLTRIHHLYIGAYDPKGGGVFHGPQVFDHPTCHHKPEITSGHQEEGAKKLLKEFFLARR
jgi:tRNA(Arg) A34 adenosine deaminase TadA